MRLFYLGYNQQHVTSCPRNMLYTCGSTYNTEIEDVIALENENRSDEGQDLDLTRDESDFYVYAGGSDVELLYNHANGEEQQIVYEEMDGGDYTRHAGMPAEVANLTNEYEEQTDKQIGGFQQNTVFFIV
ncbi:hypothetical protein SAMN05421503_0942 [Terribacillus aidingensis]|uniref:Uncharacterized protein n=1 Tax=Terribacillus aidingensis TaxID=586416 RepID=A0A285NBS1_9BACI|nr:hypothetical protein [Terribacillus aidingensis]SNZ05406.1 hypothetical protein SAMN05421503_0942 [Terribacillus aidingensis]